MLIEFRVKNFRSYRNDQTLSMVASSDSELPENTIEVPILGKRRLLRSAVIYGANASGKSNLLDAIRFLSNFVEESDEGKPDSTIPVQPFRLNDQSRNAPSEFETTFILENVRYQYGFSVDRHTVHEEWLLAYPHGQPQRWFERSNKRQHWYFGPHLKGEKNSIKELTRHNALFLSVAARFNHEQLSKVYEWFSTYLKIIQANDINEVITAGYLHEHKQRGHLVRQLIQRADLGIDDIAVEIEPFTEKSLPEEVWIALPEHVRNEMLSDGKSLKDVKMRHLGEGSDRSFSFEDESFGTKRLFALSGPWEMTLEAGYVLCVDELDASIHPILVKELVQAFHTKLNQQGAQLIFNTHDVTLLDSTIFRRDQIWFTEKDEYGATHLYPLLEFSPRKKESLAKGYLQGRYGAIPFVEGVLEGFENG